LIEIATRKLRAKSAATLRSLETGLDRIMQAWLLGAGLACAARIATSPSIPIIGTETLLPFLLLILAPFWSMVMALRWFDGPLPQPSVRFARAGRWIQLTDSQARSHRLYGAGGLMVSLLIGMLLNVPVRAIEYLAAMPALPERVPGWLGMLRLVMTFDVVLLTSLYTIAFVAALKKAPLFPRLLLAIWCVDLAMQAIIAEAVAATPGLPATVAGQLQRLLDGNVTKVLISAGLWLPYLILSARVNVTYRSRIAA